MKKLIMTVTSGTNVKSYSRLIYAGIIFDCNYCEYRVLLCGIVLPQFQGNN